MIDNGFHDNVRHWMGWSFVTLQVVYMYLAIWVLIGDARSTFVYKDILDELEALLPVDYLFKIPPLKQRCDEERDNYFQVQQTLQCFHWKEEKREESICDRRDAVKRLLDKLNRCNVEVNEELCRHSSESVSVLEFKEKYGEAYKKGDNISCDCPHSTAIAKPEMEVTVPARTPSPHPSLLATDATTTEIWTTNFRLTTATKENPTATISTTTAITTATPAGTKVTVPVPTSAPSPMSLENCRVAGSTSGALLGIVIVVLSIAVTYLHTQNRRLKRAQAMIEYSYRNRQNGDEDYTMHLV
ncbi:uncharacterized protein LOC118790888 [Megalops cyprinoides]|uniref:uncharacterized protein LOC118790888 n=1 Tax=Megalops cyprinoides TaxID=118141 RepID=UPI0018649B28|nr:uncharacterized protein LOC118790888 [Megalops cyprinoides]